MSMPRPPRLSKWAGRSLRRPWMCRTSAKWRSCRIRREHTSLSSWVGNIPPPPGMFSWTELLTPDDAAARQFYTKLLGWSFAETPMGPGMTYTVYQLDGKPAAGRMKMVGPQFQGVPPHWSSYVSVADCDAAVARATGLGAKVLVPPQDVPKTGRFSVLADPTGAVFAVIAFLPM